MIRTALAVALLAVSAVAASAQGIAFGEAEYPAPISQMTDGQLIDAWTAEQSQCRGGHGDEPETWMACGRRDLVGFELEGRDWCYGRQDEPAYQNTWHRCGPDSLRITRPL